MAKQDKLQVEDFFFRTPDMQMGSNGEFPTMNLDDMEKQLITKALEKHHGNITEAARETRPHAAHCLYRRLEKYHL